MTSPAANTPWTLVFEVRPSTAMVPSGVGPAALDEVGAGIVADRHKDARDREFGFGAVHEVLQPKSGDLVLSHDILDAAVPDEVDLLVRQGAVGHDLRGPEGYRGGGPR